MTSAALGKKLICEHCSKKMSFVLWVAWKRWYLSYPSQQRRLGGCHGDCETLWLCLSESLSMGSCFQCSFWWFGFCLWFVFSVSPEFGLGDRCVEPQASPATPGKWLFTGWVKKMHWSSMGTVAAEHSSAPTWRPNLHFAHTIECGNSSFLINSLRLSLPSEWWTL